MTDSSTPRRDPRTALAASPAPGRCCDTSPGHVMGFLQAQRINGRPEGWREAVVTTVGADGGIAGRWSDDGTAWSARHHRSLDGVVAAGDRVQLHLAGSGLYLEQIAAHVPPVVSVAISVDGSAELRRGCSSGLRE